MEMVLKVITKRYPVNRKKRYACLQRYAKLEERGMKTMRQIGGPRGIRTLDLSDANRTLSQQYRFCAHLMHCEKRKIDVYSSI